jgi:hypothetical protein
LFAFPFQISLLININAIIYYQQLDNQFAGMIVPFLFTMHYIVKNKITTIIHKLTPLIVNGNKIIKYLKAGVSITLN